MVLPNSHRLVYPAVLGNSIQRVWFFLSTGLLPSTVILSRFIRLRRKFVTLRPIRVSTRCCPSTPTIQRTRAITYNWFGLFPFRSPLLRESQAWFTSDQLLSFPWVTEMVHFTQLTLASYVFRYEWQRMTSARLPDSGISGSKFANNLPELIAVNHALLRLLTPRHPPWALSSLITGVWRYGYLLLCSCQRTNQ